MEVGDSQNISRHFSSWSKIFSAVGEPIDGHRQSVLWYRYDLLTGTAFAIAYGLVFIVGLIGNVIVLIAVYSGGGRSMRHSVTNIFLVNLAIADLLVIIACLPFTLVSNLIYRKSSHAI
jgi:hypothetical protein